MSSITILEELKQSILKDREILDKLNSQENLYKSLGFSQHIFISVKIIEKNLFLKEQLIINSDNLLLNFSTLRFLLESLIHTKLLVSENTHVFKLYYSVYLHQIKKTENLISRLEKEIDLIKQYEAEEKLKQNKHSLPIDIKDSEKVKIYFENIKSIEKELDERAEKELTIFWGDFKNMGYGLQGSLMEKELVSTYKEKLNHLNDLKKKKEKEIFESKQLKTLFAFKQSSGVFQGLKDKRSWGKKASDTGLENEYELVYELCSSLLHSTSYSLITPLDTNNQEQRFALELIHKYSNAARENIKEFIKYDEFSRIKTINIK